METLLQDVDLNDDAGRICGIVNESFQSTESAASHEHRGSFFVEGMQGGFVTRCDDTLHVDQLAEEQWFIFNRNRARQEVHLIDARFEFIGHPGKYVAGKEGEGVGALTIAVGFGAGDNRQVMRHAFCTHECGEFFFATRLGVANPPGFTFGGCEGGEGLSGRGAHAFNK